MQIRGKKYPIAKINGVIKITKTEITTGTNATGEITDVSSNHEEYATVEKVSGTTDKIKIIGVAKGTATITAKYTNEIYATIPVRVKGNVTVSTQVENISDSEEVGTATAITNAPYAEGSSISLTATVTNTDYQFVGWYETKDSGSETSTPVSTNSSYNYTVPNDGAAEVLLKAKFEKIPNLLGTTANDSGVGYYIRKGSEYAIVFADRVAQAGRTITWRKDTPSSVSGGSYCTFPQLTDAQKAGFKTYRLNGTYTDSKFGTKDVLEVVDNTGEERFMALALTNYQSAVKWYNAACISPYMSDYWRVTSINFGNGKENTEKMLKKGIAGSNGGYGELTSDDIWYKLMSGWTDAMKTSWTTNGYNAVASDDTWGKVEDGWFIPSFQEWSAFGYAMKNGNLKAGVITYSSLGLNQKYWSSSQESENRAFIADFDAGFLGWSYVNATCYVRLAIKY